MCDALFWYAKSDAYVWNQLFRPFTPDYVATTFKYKDRDGRCWQSVTLRNPGQRPNLHYPYKASNGVTYKPHPNGWSCDIDRMRKYDREDRLHFPKSPHGALRLKMYLDESLGQRVQNLWDDIPPISSQAAERLGYPTQKPEALLERIVKASSIEGDVVLDPFCGCGTAVAVAQKLNRRWIGIDVTHLAIGLIKHRLHDSCGLKEKTDYRVVGEPEDLSGAQQLAQEDPFQFQAWALGLVGARVASSAKKGADKGIDGRLFFDDEGDEKAAVKQVVFSVKAGKTGSAHVRDLVGVITREEKSGARIGVLISLQTPTADMRKEAASAGFYTSPGRTQHRRIQLLTVEDLLNGEKLDIPLWHASATFKRAPKSRTPSAPHPELF